MSLSKELESRSNNKCELCDKEHEKNDYNTKSRNEINYKNDLAIREKLNSV